MKKEVHYLFYDFALLCHFAMASKIEFYNALYLFTLNTFGILISY
ncbi:hypothetical protein CULT_2210001 [[Clostridium] ultunense Esp]|nr:hypothetical protein CULT_2210001 [[Clostridium] ultunense Esp]